MEQQYDNTTEQAPDTQEPMEKQVQNQASELLAPTMYNVLHAVSAIQAEIAKVIVGQIDVLQLLIAGILSGGHILIEGVPGVAKTLTAKLLARSIQAPFSRIQFTPDLMPSDVLGTSIYNPRTNNFEFKAGPIFSSIILIDEINRSPAKTQAALFEVMEEKQITIDGTTHTMQTPFMVLATQNPIEQEGTYRLPEAQLDRFLFKINVPYPTPEQEVTILANHHALQNNEALSRINTILTSDTVTQLQAQVKTVYADAKLLPYIAQIVTSTRTHGAIYMGASPRASIGILNASKAIAAMAGRNFITPDDVKYVAKPVLRHRIILTPDKEMEGVLVDDVITEIINEIEIPR